MHSIKKENPITPDSPSVPNLAVAYFLASRPKTWIAGLSPVWIGGALASRKTEIDYKIFFLTLLFSLLIQIGTNFANDYFDFLNGADTNLRKGPKRATQEGWISPIAMQRAAIAIFLSAFLTAIPLMAIAGLWSLPVALLCIAFGILYTGGPKPLGYLGLGEFLVLIFFGPVAVCGTYFLQTFSLSPSIFIASLSPGLISCAILIANNLRDEISDRATNKRTLIVRLGHRFGCWEYSLALFAALLVPAILILFYGAPLPLSFASLFIIVFIPQIRKAFRSLDPNEIASLLPVTALILLLYTTIFCLTYA